MLLFLIDLKYIVAIEVLNNYITAHNDMLSWVIKINTINKYKIKVMKMFIFVELFIYALHDYLSIYCLSECLPFYLSVYLIYSCDHRVVIGDIIK